MKTKNLLYLLLLAAACPFSAEAFLLPPFKVDASVIGQEVMTYGNTSSQSAAKGIQQSSIIQTAITYGQGAKEAYEFATKMLNEFKGVNLNNLGENLDKLSEMEAEQSKTKEEAAAEVTAKTEETNAKIAAIDENIRELNKKMVEDPENTKKYQKEIRKLEKEKDKLAKDLVKETRQINRKTEKKIGQLNDQIGELRGQVQDLISSITNITADYDSTEDLNQTAETLLPSNPEEVDTHVVAVYGAIYRVAYFQTLGKAMGRAMLLKSIIAEDNEKAEEEKLATAELESEGGAIGTIVKMKTNNIQSLLNFTELLLQRLQLDIAADLALQSFSAADPAQATGAFNLDNYRFTPPDESELETEDAKKQEDLDELDEEITPTSGSIFSDGGQNLTSPAEEGKESAAESGSDEQ